MKEVNIQHAFADFFVHEEIFINNDDICKFIYKQKEKNEGPSIWFDGTEPELAQFYGVVQTYLDAMHTKLSLYPKLKQRLFQAWANINMNEFISVPHSHSERAYAVISGVYYPKADENCHPIEFASNNRSVEHVIFPEIVDEVNEFNCGHKRIVPKTGTLLLFPSWLIHYVVPVGTAKEDRISLAFNADMVPKE